jgi:peptide deformylase
MLELMRAHHGIGLATPQIGLLVRLIVADIGDGPVCLVNPLLTPAPPRDRMTEGCLSLPGVVVEIERPQIVEVRGLDQSGAPVHFEARGLLARVLQHEVDHLEGVLIVDYPAATAGGRSLPEERCVTLA